jgi:hypothetical protein
MTQYVLTGFTQDVGFRVFAFEGIGEDRLRTKFVVRAELSLAQKYGIRIQELPLMCRALLDRQAAGEEKHLIVFTEDEMALYARTSLAAREAAAQKRKPPRRPPSENIGAAWRAPQP